MASNIYSIAGTVTDAASGQGIGNLTVEAWALNSKMNVALGSSDTDNGGQFVICMDLNRLQLERAPSVYFKVYRNTILLESTEDSFVLQSGDQKDMVITLTLPVERPAGKDRITAFQVFKAADFWDQSDFNGVYTNAKKNVSTRVGLFSDMVMNTLTKMDISPLRHGPVNGNAVLNQDVESTREKFATQNIAVQEVLPYDPKPDSSFIKNIANLPLNLKSGQKVNLYQENGKVKYYSLVTESVATTPLTGTALADQQVQLSKMQDELDVTKQKVAEKDDQILKLQDQLLSVRKDQDKVNSLMKSALFLKLMKDSGISNDSTIPSG